jgi:hypothetical protein
MKVLIEIFIISVNLVIISYSQDKLNASKVENQKHDFIVYNKFYFSDVKTVIDKNPNSIWLWTSFTISYSNSYDGKFQANTAQILSPLVQLYLDKSKINPMLYILGLVQYGAVGYMAYEHIKNMVF